MQPPDGFGENVGNVVGGHTVTFSMQKIRNSILDGTICGISYKPRTGNTRKSKFIRN